jgi:hypothetical protein
MLISTTQGPLFQTEIALETTETVFLLQRHRAATDLLYTRRVDDTRALGESEAIMTLNQETLRGLLMQLEQQHGSTQELRPVEPFLFTVFLDDGAEYQLRWPRGVRNPAWEVNRRH